MITFLQKVWLYRKFYDKLIQGGAKIVLKNDVLKAKSNTASSLDIVTSFIDDISS